MYVWEREVCAVVTVEVEGGRVLGGGVVSLKKSV